MEAIAVVSCVWQRPERLARLLDQLAAQTHADFDLHLINNNPELEGFVEETVGAGSLPVTIYHMRENGGPFARVQLMHQLSSQYAWFMTIDDDAEFGPRLVADWWATRDAGAVRGWSGFRFTGDYWQRETALPGEACHYLWGSNLFVPAAAVEDKRVLDAPSSAMQCDDLWLCYHANHVAGLALKAQAVDMRINVDGKDTYPAVAGVKREFLEYLRAKGWGV